MCTYKYLHLYIYIHKQNYIQKTVAKRSSFACNKSSSDDEHGLRHGFRTEASLSILPDFIGQFDLDECHIRSDTFTVLFWIFFYIFPLLCW